MSTLQDMDTPLPASSYTISNAMLIVSAASFLLSPLLGTVEAAAAFNLHTAVQPSTHDSTRINRSRHVVRTANNKAVCAPLHPG